MQTLYIYIPLCLPEIYRGHTVFNKCRFVLKCIYLFYKVLVGHPMNGRQRGEHLLQCMLSLAPNIHEDLVGLWDAVIPKLLTHLSGKLTVNCIQILHHRLITVPFEV